MNCFRVQKKKLYGKCSKFFVIILGFSFTLLISLVKYLIGPEWALSASQVAKKLRSKLLELARINGWAVTFSIGVATFLCPPAKIDEMVETADAQMYFAKQKGKNRIRHKIIAES